MSNSLFLSQTWHGRSEVNTRDYELRTMALGCSHKHWRDRQEQAQEARLLPYLVAKCDFGLCQQCSRLCLPLEATEDCSLVTMREGPLVQTALLASRDTPTPRCCILWCPSTIGTSSSAGCSLAPEAFGRNSQGQGQALWLRTWSFLKGNALEELLAVLGKWIQAWEVLCGALRGLSPSRELGCYLSEHACA